MGVVSAVLSALPCAPALADVQLSSENTARVTAYGGVQAWLRQDRSGGRQVFRLVLRRNGAVADAPIGRFVDNPTVDLGPGAAPGSVLADYTRCSGELFSRRCSIYELDVASGRERRVSALASRRASAVAPSTWAGRYAFGRTPLGLSSRTHGSHRYGLFSGKGRAARIGSDIPSTTDVDAGAIAYDGGAGDGRGFTRSQIRVRRLHGKANCVIDRRTERFDHPTDDDTVTTPVLAGGYVYWVLHGSLGTSPVRIRRLPVPGAGCRLGQVEAAGVELPPVTTGFAVDGAKMYYANSRGVFEADLPAFAAI